MLHFEVLFGKAGHSTECRKAKLKEVLQSFFILLHCDSLMLATPFGMVLPVAPSLPVHLALVSTEHFRITSTDNTFSVLYLYDDIVYSFLDYFLRVELHLDIETAHQKIKLHWYRCRYQIRT